MKACLLLLAMLSAMCAQEVTVHRCAPADLPWPNSQACVMLDPNPPNANTQIFDISPCTNPLTPYCPGGVPTTGKPILCSATAPASPGLPYGQMPGNYCRTSTDCQGTNPNCVMGFCSGATGTCTTNADCNPGYYCSGGATSVCTAYLTDPKAACTDDTECPIQSGCNNGLCVQFYSVEVGGTVGDCGGNKYAGFVNPGVTEIFYSNFCSSGTCNADKTTCAAPMATSSNTEPIPIACDPSGKTPNQCASTNGAATNVLTGNLGCTTALDGNYYCETDMGDTPFKNYLNWLTGTYIPLATKNQNICHTTQRGLTQSCLVLLGGQYLYNEYLTYTQYALHYGKYANVDYCAQTVYAPEITVTWQYNKFCDTTFSCANNSTAWSSPLGCIQQNENTKSYLIRPCTDFASSYCYNTHNYWRNNEVDCTSPYNSIAPISPAYPGDLCTKNSDCPSYNCNQGVCAGSSAKYCTTDIDCNPGFYCSSTQNPSVCTALVAIGKACTSSIQCVMNAGCNLANGQGTCVQYYTVESGQTVSDCGTSNFISTMTQSSSILMGSGTAVSYSAMCASGTCTLLPTGGQNMGTCVPAYKATAGASATCNFLKTDCPVSNGVEATNTVTGCGCGRSTGLRYCGLELGDAQFTTLFTWANNFISRTAGTTQCHTYRRGLDPVCMKNLEYGGMNTTTAYYIAYFEATHHQIIQDADQCTLQVFLPEYWAAKQYNVPYTPPSSSRLEKPKEGGIEKLLG